MRFRIFAIAATLLTCLPMSRAAGQQDSAVASERRNTLARLNRSTFTPAVNAPLRSLTPAAFLSASDGESQAQIEGGFNLADHPVLGALSLGVSATTPVTEGSDATTLLAATGLSSGTKVSLSIGGIIWRFGTMANGRAVCRRLKQSRAIDTSFDCEANGMRWDTLPQGPREQIGRAIRRSGGPPVLYEFTGSIAHDEFNFLDATTFDARSAERTARSLGADVGVVLSGTMITLGVHYDVSYAPGDNAEICQPVGTTTTLRCQTSAIGAPSEQKGTAWSGQIRRYVSRTVGINPQAVYRPDGNKWSAEVPVYFVSNGDGALIGGIAPGYNSTGQKWNLRLFVGTAFGFRLR